MDELKPCPFCGCTEVGLRQLKGMLCVQCDACEASGPWNRTEADSIAAWNQRALIAALQQEAALTELVRTSEDLGLYDTQQAQSVPCDMGEICIGCEPRREDGSCPGAQSAPTPAEPFNTATQLQIAIIKGLAVAASTPQALTDEDIADLVADAAYDGNFPPAWTIANSLKLIAFARAILSRAGTAKPLTDDQATFPEHSRGKITNDGKLP